jgi:hypothetical protein
MFSETVSVAQRLAVLHICLVYLAPGIIGTHISCIPVGVLRTPCIRNVDMLVTSKTKRVEYGEQKE